MSMDCSDDFNFKSSCTFTCKEGFFMKSAETGEKIESGVRKTVCWRGVSEAVTWTASVPECELKKCPILVASYSSYASCTDWVRVGSVCELTCWRGYERVGPKYLSCIDGKHNNTVVQWNNTVPTCIPRKCDELEMSAPTFSVSCSKSNVYSSSCTFFCAKGHFLTVTGSKNTSYLREGRSVCEVDENEEMVWTPPPYRCKIKRCRGSLNVDNAVTSCTKGDKYLSTCSFTCYDAYFMIGDGNRTCLEHKENSKYGKWSSLKPWCRPKVCEPLQYDNKSVTVTCTDGNKYDSRCVFQCFPGHVMTTVEEILIESGTLETSCVINELRQIGWRVPAPICHSQLCDPLEEPTNGQVFCTDENNHASICTFSCSVGYIVEGSESLVCEDRGTIIPKPVWSDSSPECKTKPCEIFEYDRASINLDCSNGFSFLSTCTFTCKEGFYMTSSSTGEIVNLARTTCSLNREMELIWTSEVPACLMKTCRDLRIPEHSSMKCNDESNYDSVCTFSCFPGYELDGVDKLRCVDDGINKPTGTWSDTPPTCTPRLCRDINFNGESMTTECDSGFQFRSTCDVSCRNGYYMMISRSHAPENSVTTECKVKRNEMLWSNPIPLCIIKLCSELEDPKNGLVRCDNDNVFNSVCAFYCYPGYELNGSDSTTCFDRVRSDKNGQWSRDPPTCKKKLCPTPARKQRELSENCTEGYLFESICFYSCTEGFYLSTERGVAAINKHPVECGITGRDMTWSSTLPVCDKITCPALGSPANGDISCSLGANIGSECKFSCIPGYAVKGEESLFCTQQAVNNASGMWTVAAPVCEERSCSELASSPALKSNCTNGIKFKSTCIFSCETGHYLTKSDNTEFLPAFSTTCTVDKSLNMIWSEDPPICRSKKCEKAITPEEGTASCSNGNAFNSVCTLTCLPGYSLQGNPETVCNVDPGISFLYANWSNGGAKCKARSCPKLSLKDKVNVNCSREEKYRSNCIFGCTEGYYLSSEKGDALDSAVTTCDVKDDKMFWTRSSPKCSIKRCTRVKDPTNGNVKCSDGNKYASICTFSCSIVHEISGAEQITCEDDGKNSPVGVWSAWFPVCELRSCETLDYDENAFTETCSNEYKYGSSCFYSCEKGYYEATPSGRPPAVDFKILTCGIEGTDMIWVGTLPNCKIKSCRPPKFPKGEYFCTSGTNFRSVCTFVCNQGFLLIGKNTMTCQDNEIYGPDGIWEGVPPACEPRSCTTLVYEKETQIVDCSFGNEYGTTCDFKCIEGYYMTENDGLTLTGAASIACDVNPTNSRQVKWKGQNPKCFIKTCPEIEPPSDGSVSCDKGVDFGSKCHITCLPGFKVVGNAQTACRNTDENVPDAEWSKEPAVCEPKSCPRLINTENTTTFTCSEGWKYRSICTFTCSPGYFITKADGRTPIKSGKRTTRCDKGSGTGMAWTASIPNCMSKFCLAIRPQRNRTMECTDAFRFSSRCKFKCDEPLKLIGKRQVTCLADGTLSPSHGRWDSKPPRCKRK